MITTAEPLHAPDSKPAFGTRRPSSAAATAVIAVGLAFAACSPDPAPEPPAEAWNAATQPVSELTIAADPGAARPPFEFSAADAALLDEVQRGSFNFFWNASAPDALAPFAPDRTSRRELVSLAGVGFQLAAFCVGVERGWATRADAEARARQILTALASSPNIAKAGFFQHFIDARDAGLIKDAPENVVSTIDSAIFFAGALVASSYFGGEVARLGDSLVERADWRFVQAGPEAGKSAGFISLGWKPASKADPTGAGSLLPHQWWDCGDEHRLVKFLAVAAPRDTHRIPPEMYYRLRRPVGQYIARDGSSTGPMVYLPWSGAHFTNFFAHCFIHYAAMGPDNPASFGVSHRPRVDWWENSRRATTLQRLKAIDHAAEFPTLGPDAWGLTACDGPSGYLVPGVYPAPIRMLGAAVETDFAEWTPKDDFGGGTLAPYGAASSIMFEPTLALRAMRHHRAVAHMPGMDRVWSNPASGGFGFADSYNLSPAWVAPDHVAIDHGPTILAIENARTGLIWRLFHRHPIVRSGTARLGLMSPE